MYLKILDSTFHNAVRRELHYLELNSGGELSDIRYEREEGQIVWITFRYAMQDYSATFDYDVRELHGDESHYLNVVLEDTGFEQVIDLDFTLRSVLVAPEEDELDGFYQTVRQEIRKQFEKLYNTRA